MKKFIIITIAASLFANVACKKSEEKKADIPAAPVAEAPKQEEPQDYCSTVTVDSLKGLVQIEDKGKMKVISDDSYAEILNSLQCCKINEKTFSIDKKTCITYQVLDEIKKETRAKEPSIQNVMGKLVQNASPLVRAEGYKAISSILGANDKDLAIGKEAIKRETDPYALQALVAGLVNEGNKDTDIAQFLLDMSKHENKYVRRKAAIALANSWSDKIIGATEAVIAMMDDEDENVAKLACSGAGRLGDERVIDPIAKILNDNTKERLHAECVRGLATMWLDFPKHNNHNEKAYRATMDYYKKTPRTQKIPAWNTITTFSTVAKKEIGHWKSEATWFNIDEFISIMGELIKDPNMNWLGKGPAMKAVAGLGGKSALEKLRPFVEGQNDPKVRDAYKTELEKAE